MILHQVLTAQNATVEMPRGHSVGYLQNVTINAAYNLTPVKNLYQHEVQYYAQNVSIYSVSAQRAFVELEAMFGNPDSLLSLYNNFQDAKNILTEKTSASDQLASTIAGIGTFIKTATDVIQGVSQKGLNYFTDKIKEIINSQSDPMDFFTQMAEFEVIIKNPLIQLPDFIPDQFNNIIDRLIGSSNTLITLSGCKVNARTITMIPQNIAVMENVTIVARKMTDTLFSNQKMASLFPAPK